VHVALRYVVGVYSTDVDILPQATVHYDYIMTYGLHLPHVLGK